MVENFFDFINGLTHMASFVCIAVVIATFILEDAATIAAVGFAVTGTLDPYLLYLSVLLGVIWGDIGLYYIGVVAEKNKWWRTKTARYDLVKYKQTIHKHSIMAIVTSRFIPGARTPTYLAIGYFHVSFFKFIMTAVIAVGVWTSFLFWGLYFFGNILLPYVSGWVPVGFALLIVTFYTIITKLKTKKYRQEKKCTHKN